jgi:hypothetical protein
MEPTAELIIATVCPITRQVCAPEVMVPVFPTTHVHVRLVIMDKNVKHTIASRICTTIRTFVVHEDPV